MCVEVSMIPEVGSSHLVFGRVQEEREGGGFGIEAQQSRAGACSRPAGT